MRNKYEIASSDRETITISRSEYEQLRSQGERIAELEMQVERLLEAIRLSQQK